MCRSIVRLRDRDEVADDAAVRAAALQFVRKISGYTKPSQANEAAFERAVDDVTAIARRLLDELVTTAPPRDREAMAARARARYEQRGAPQPA